MSAFWDKVKKSKEKEKEEGPKASVAKDEKKDVKSDKKSGRDEKPAQDGKAKKKAKKRILSQQEAKISEKVLVNPKISEAAMNQQTLGKYVFLVSKRATKQEISQAIEAFYGVDVTKVNVANYGRQLKNFRGVPGSKKAFKKAVVTIKGGQSIDIFKEGK